MNSQKGNVVMILLLVVMMVLVAGGTFYFLTLNQKNSDYQAALPSNNVAYPQPTAAQSSSLSGELNSIQIDDTDNSFSQVDQDLKDL